jgi:hypothetical protein
VRYEAGGEGELQNVTGRGEVLTTMLGKGLPKDNGVEGRGVLATM